MSNRRSHLPAAWVCALCMTASPVFAAPGERLPVDAPGSRSAVATARHAATSPAVVVKDGRLSVRLENGSLGRVLEEISRQARVAIIDEGGDGRRRMSAQLQDVALDEGLRQLLKDEDAFFFYGGEGQGPATLRAVWVYAKGKGRGLEPVPPESWASTRDLERALADPDPKTRARAIGALIERKGGQALSATLAALKDEDDQVRSGALYESLNGDVELPTDVLRDLALSDPSSDVRFLALDAVEGRPEALAIAEQALGDASPHVRSKAEEILRGADASTHPPSPSQSLQGRSPQPERR